MTFSYPYKYVTPVKVANYDMLPYELVQFDPTGGTYTLSFPPNTTYTAEPTHGEIVGIKNVTFSDLSITISSTYPVESPVGLELTSFDVAQQDVSLQWCFDANNSVWRLLTYSKPFYIPEVWVTTGDVVLGTGTQLPLVFQTDFFPLSVFFQANSGDIECIRNFGGYIDLIAYIEFVATTNNQEGLCDIDLIAITGTPSIRQGYGIVASFISPRSGTFFEQRFLTTIVKASVGDVIRLRGSTTGAAVVTAAAPSGLYARNV
jgi:hypothetical protein